MYHSQSQMYGGGGRTDIIYPFGLQFSIHEIEEGEFDEDNEERVIELDDSATDPHSMLLDYNTIYQHNEHSGENVVEEDINPYYPGLMGFDSLVDPEQSAEDLMELCNMESSLVADADVDVEMSMEIEQGPELEMNQSEHMDMEIESETTEQVELFIPKRVFIVPYRNRPQHKFFFSKYMTFLLEDEQDYEIYFSHQCDQRTFNRGAAKNIGFLAIKAKYPEHYKDMTFIFNDVDTIPFHKLFSYQTTKGVVKHHYGYKYALGGIVVIKGSDFEAINGFPCYWGWGMEDNALQRRCDQYKLKIDRSQFFEIGSPEILQLFDGISRIISKKEPHRIKTDNGIDGLRKISGLNFSFDYKSANPADNVYDLAAGENENIYFINIRKFDTYEKFESKKFYSYDLREPAKKILNPDHEAATSKLVSTTSDWTHIPHYPTMKENRENAAKALLAAGKAVPPLLAKQIEMDRLFELDTDVYNATSAKARKMPAPQVVVKPAAPSAPLTAFQALVQSNGGVRGGHGLPPAHFANVQAQILKQQLLTKRLNAAALAAGGNKYSPYYAKAIGTRERATKSANIGLGGIMPSRR